MFLDQVTLTLSAGKGGDGVIAWRREKYIPKGGPAGGNGGNGGSVILEASSHELSLERFFYQKVFSAENGVNGSSSCCQGRRGNDLILKVPLGTLVKEGSNLLYDFTKEKEQFLLCKRGLGGKGNASFKSSTNQAPFERTLGTPGDKKIVELELKLIADIGLVGFPNAGKSTLLFSLTNVPVKIAPYPFTTLSPILGLLQKDLSRIFIADIPGIIEGAHLNKGLGLAFLRHIERTSMLLFVIDLSAQDGQDPIQAFEILQKELSSYNPALLQKPFYVILNKIDSLEAQENLPLFLKSYRYDPSTLFVISAKNKEGLEPLKEALMSFALN